MKPIFMYMFLFILHLIILQSEAVVDNLYQVMKKTDNLWKAVENVIKNCFTTYFGNSIFIGNWTAEENTILYGLYSNTIPVTLVADNENSIYQKQPCVRGFFQINETVISTKCSLVNNVTIIVSSNTTLVNILKNLKTSVWWNNEAYFLLVNTDSRNGCRSAKKFLKIIWNFKILSALYFCKDGTGRVMIYNFNPFTRLGSNYWQVAYDSDKKSRRWTLLEYSFNISSSFNETHSMRCDNFDFDKTRDLNEYHIRMGTVVNDKNKNKYSRSGTLSFAERDFKIFNLLLEKLNARASIKKYRTFGFISKDGPVGFLKDIEQGEIDFLLFQMFIRDYWKQMTYPFDTNGVCIVARMYPVSFARRFISIFTFRVWLCLFATGLVSIITLKFTLNQSLIASVLDFLRMFTNTPSLREPLNSRGKIFFVNILYLIFEISSYIQSRLSAIQTVPDYTPTIDTPDDLVKTNLPVFGEVHHREFVFHSVLRRRFQVIRDIHVCLQDLISEKKLVCLTHCDLLVTHAYLNDEIYRAKSNLFNRPIAFTFVEDWPLAAKVNSLLRHIDEVGIYWLNHKNDVKNLDKARKDQSTASLEQLTFCFFIFFWGCGLSVCTLIVEIVIYKLRK